MKIIQPSTTSSFKTFWRATSPLSSRLRFGHNPVLKWALDFSRPWWTPIVSQSVLNNNCKQFFENAFHPIIIYGEQTKKRALLVYRSRAVYRSPSRRQLLFRAVRILYQGQKSPSEPQHKNNLYPAFNPKQHPEPLSTTKLPTKPPSGPTFADSSRADSSMIFM